MLEEQPVALLLGAAVLAVFQAAKFAELDIGDPVTSRYVSLLPGAKAKDFANPVTYNISLAVFLCVSLILYYLVCQISPALLEGAARQFTMNPPKFDGVPYPLYVAAIFMGLTQPVIPGLARVGDALRTFFHNRIEVPKRIVELSENLTTAIEARSRSDKIHLAREVRNLIHDDWLRRLATCGDLAFYKLQLQRIDLGDPATVEKTLHDASVKELRTYIEQLVLFNLIAVMKKSGPQHLPQIVNWSQADFEVPPSNSGPLISGLLLSGLVFGFLLFLIWLVLNLMGHHVVVPYFQPRSLWPNEQWLGVELARIVPAMFIGLLISIYLFEKETADEAYPQTLETPKSIDGLIKFATSIAQILIICFSASLLIHFLAELYQYGLAKEQASIISPTKIAIIFIRTAPSVALSYCALLYLASQRTSKNWPFGLMAILVAIATSILALIVSLFFLRLDFLPAYQDYSGWDYVMFYVVANLLVAEGAFATIVMFFRAQTAAPNAIKALKSLKRHPQHS